jgi:hypothetical protein
MAQAAMRKTLLGITRIHYLFAEFPFNISDLGQGAARYYGPLENNSCPQQVGSENQSAID